MSGAIGRTVALVVFAATMAAGQVREIAATVTYVAAGQVYVGAGRLHGVSPPVEASVMRGSAVMTSMRLVAASSRSSSWVADSGLAAVRIGDTVRIRMAAAEIAPSALPDTTTPDSGPTILRTNYRRPERPLAASAIEVVGRAGAQTIAQSYGDRAQNFLQNGLLISARARARDLPLKLDVYASLRDATRGGARPFSSRSSGASRIYRAVLEFDDGQNLITLGRSTLLSAPTTGVLDGLTYARRWGDFTTGAGLGVSPEMSLQGTDLLRKRLLLFATYQPAQWSGATLSGAYAKTWYRGGSERELVNVTGGVAISERLSLWSSTDVDLRVAASGAHRLDPSLSLLLVTASWRATDRLSLTGGIDASRSVLPFSFARSIPDSMTDHTLRSGVTMSGSWMLPYGLSLAANITPRLLAGRFNGDYAGSTTFAAYDVFRTGVGVRVQSMLNQSQMSTGHGYGLTTSVHAWNVDWSLRAQMIRYRLRTQSLTTTGRTLGLDAMVPLLDRLSWLVSVDVVEGFGSASRSLYSEFSWRF